MKIVGIAHSCLPISSSAAAMHSRTQLAAAMRAERSVTELSGVSECH